MVNHVVKRLTAEGRPVLRGVDHIWTVVRGIDREGPWAVPDIEARSNDHRSTIIGFVRRLVRGGVAREVGTRPAGIRGHVAKTYRLVARPAETPRLRRDGSPVQLGRGQQQMWTAIRALGSFTVAEIAVAATTDDCRVAPRTAESYLRRLAGAGYLAASTERPTIYRLKPSMNTGPKPPRICGGRGTGREAKVVDGNRPAGRAR